MLNDEQINFFHRYGYILIREVFTTKEVKRLRSVCELKGSGEILGRKEFEYILIDDRIVYPLKQLLGEDIVYFGESNVSLSVRGRHMHNDSKNDDFDFSESYPVVRIGLYLRDYENYSGGLKLRPGSHRKYCIDKYGVNRALKFLKRTRDFSAFYTGRSINVPSRASDLLIWNLRIHHSGHAIRVRGLKNHSFHPAIEDRIPTFLRHPNHKKRSVIFASYGAPSKQLENYIENRVQRPDKRSYWIECSKCRFDRSEIQDLAKTKGVTIRSDGIDNVVENAKKSDV